MSENHANNQIQRLTPIFNRVIGIITIVYGVVIPGLYYAALLVVNGLLHMGQPSRFAKEMAHVPLGDWLGVFVALMFIISGTGFLINRYRAAHLALGASVLALAYVWANFSLTNFSSTKYSSVLPAIVYSFWPVLLALFSAYSLLTTPINK